MVLNSAWDMQFFLLHKQEPLIAGFKSDESL